MVKQIKARFIDGRLEPLEHMDLQEGQEVLISAEEAPAPRKRPGKSFGADSLLRLQGIGQRDEATDVLVSIEAAPAPGKKPRKRGKAFTSEDSLWNLVGMARGIRPLTSPRTSTNT